MGGINYFSLCHVLISIFTQPTHTSLTIKYYKWKADLLTVKWALGLDRAFHVSSMLPVSTACVTVAIWYRTCTLDKISWYDRLT